ncbi:MAG TPA: alcohol dehydrogenase catalytic domain-containing protein [Ktedonosporobacter sp.]|nr:alcohol dehydrogenase catalytic domain-containing protein [Ktedonosporobacter sp.]
MWTSTLDLDPRRVILTRLLWRIWPGVCFSSVAPLRVLDVPRQTLPASNWVRVRNRLAGICGSDLHFICGDGDFRVAPAALPGHRHMYLGHEVLGEVIEVGEDVKRLHVGDRVVLQYGPNCLSSGVQSPCRSCQIGNYNLCQYGILPDPQPIGGGWSEEMLLPEQQLFPVAPLLSDEQAVMLEPTAVAVHAVLRYLPSPGARVLIIGAGTIGLLTLQVVRALVPEAEISVMARHAFQVEQATRMGAEHIIYPQDSYADVQHATEGRLYRGMLGNQMLLGGYDVVYDTVGRSSTVHHALRWARAQATVVLVGVNLHMMHLDLSPVWYQEVNLLGTMGQGMETWPPGSSGECSTFRVAVELIERGLIHPEQLITHHFALGDYRNALRSALGKSRSRAIKVVFDYSLQPPSVVPTVRASARKPANEPLIASTSARQSLQEDISEFIDSVSVPAAPIVSGHLDEGNAITAIMPIQSPADDQLPEEALQQPPTTQPQDPVEKSDNAVLSGDTDHIARITTAELANIPPQTSQEASIAATYAEEISANVIVSTTEEQEGSPHPTADIVAKESEQDQSPTETLPEGEVPEEASPEDGLLDDGSTGGGEETSSEEDVQEEAHIEVALADEGGSEEEADLEIGDQAIDGTNGAARNGKHIPAGKRRKKSSPRL